MLTWVNSNPALDAFSVAISLLTFWLGFAIKAYGITNRRVTAVLQVLLGVVLVGLVVATCYLISQGRMEGYPIGVAAVAIGMALVLSWKQSLANSGAQADTPAITTEETEQAFGEYRLAVEGDRVLVRHIVAFPPWIALAFVASLFAMASFHHWPVGGYAFVMGYLGRGVGEIAKARRLQVLIAVRGGEIITPDASYGPADAAKISVTKDDSAYLVQLRRSGQTQSAVLCKTKSSEAANGIAGVIREFLDRRAWEHVWPPAPEVVGVDE